MDHNFSIVHYFSEQAKHRCGYCKQLKSSATYGMWAQCLTVHDYQDLIDRGWRRSGKYCYKPIMDVTCCPMYTIRCEALRLKLSKSQKKILKRVNKFLNEGIKEQLDSHDRTNESYENAPLDIVTTNRTHVEIDANKINVSDLEKLNTDLPSSTNQCDENTSSSKVQNEEQNSFDKQEVGEDSSQKPTIENMENTEQDEKCRQVPYMNIDYLYVWIEHYFISNISETFYIWFESFSINDILRTFWEGIDPSKPPCKKAKLMRIERKRQKLAAKGIELDTMKKNEKQQEGKSLEQFLSEISRNPKHKLRISLVRTTPKSEEWLRTSKISHDVYVKYQMAVHGDSREKCSENQFTRFLVESPLEALYTDNGPRDGYGSFHQQYWLDDRLIAVGVIDILPKCISSVYFFYDPDFSNLSLGTYGSLRELNFTRELHQNTPELQYYYMGYYIHSCPKMRYKANLTPSFLLCPETYFWFSIETCLPKLNIDAYARFNDDPDAIDINACTPTDIDNIPILYKFSMYRYGRFRSHFKIKLDSEMLEYANLVGKHCASRMLVVKE